ncbi:hypothetical protein KSP40_PGU016871 [Platanthera guangdongensis]|uniref:C3H1-type domain-containing protein n=1 Tax=Platanthera guangdongensis TaxID=2320717 RepID=A0ABR2M996_9ASPA
MKTGECKYGATCKYHHPLDWRLPVTNYTLSPLGLPLRPVRYSPSFFHGNALIYLFYRCCSLQKTDKISFLCSKLVL